MGGPSSLAAPAADGFGPTLLEALDGHGAHARMATQGVPSGRVPAVMALHSAARRATLDRFLSTLDPAALDLATRFKDRAPMLGRAWLAMDRTFTPDAPLADLLRDCPAFAGTLLRLAGVHVGVARHLRDDRRQLDAALAAAATADGVPKGFLPVLAEAGRFVTALEGRMGDGVQGDGRLARMRRDHQRQRDWAVALVRRAARFPREWAPSGREQWEAFLDLCPVLDAVAGWCVESLDLVRLVNAGGDWAAFRVRLHAAAGLAAPVDVLGSSGVENAVADIHDVAVAYARDVLRPSCAATWHLPAKHREGGQEWVSSAWALLNSGRSLPRMLEASRDWHRRRARMAMAVAAMPTSHGDTLAWGKGLPDATLDGIGFRVLATEGELVDEGREGLNADGSAGLGNCIGGYSEECLTGASRVVSLRAPGASPPRRLSVAEVHVTHGRDGPAFRVHEHRGPGNGPASAGCEAALDAYVAALASGTLPVDVAALVPMPVVGDPVARQCRFD